MKNLIYICVACVALLIFAGSASSDILRLHNGKSFEGSFKGSTDGVVSFETDGMMITVPVADVKEIDSGGSKSTASDVATEKVEKKTVSVPAGTVLHVRTKDALNSSRHKQGHKFTAILESDLVVNGVVVAPRGSVLYGQLADSKQAGRVVGKSEMTIMFTGLMINNQIKPLQSGQVQAVASSGSGANTASKAVRGAAIGGLIDGKSGARTGAKVGAGAALLTRGGSINIPAGTLLDVPLAAPFTP